MVLIIAYGNSLRRDDGAGFILAGELREYLFRAGAAARCIECHQLTPELALDIAAEDVSAVVFVDTRVVSSSDDLKLHLREVYVPVCAGSPAGHHMDCAVLMAYAGLFSKKFTPRAWLLTVPGSDFGHGEGFSEETQGILRNAPEELKSLAARVLMASSAS